MARKLLRNWNLIIAAAAVAFAVGAGHLDGPTSAGINSGLCTPVNQIC